MAESLLLVLALTSTFGGMAWLALAMEVHWRQVCASAATTPVTARLLRLTGATAMLVSLVLCLLADHPSIAVLVWVMMLAGCALSVALLLAWRPHWLSLMVLRPPTRACRRD